MQQVQTAGEKLKGLSGEQWRVIILLWLAQTVAASIYNALPATIPFIKAEFDLVPTQVGLMASALSFGQMLMVIPLGYFVDTLGEKKILLFSLIVVGLIGIAISQVKTFSIVLVALMLIGAGYSSISPGTNKAIVNWIPIHWRATAIGYKQTGPTLGGVVAAALVPLVTVIGWQKLYALLGVISLIFGISWVWLYQEARLGPAHSRNNPGFYELFGLVFLNKHIVLLGFAGFILGANQFSLLTYTSLYLKEGLGFSAVVAGMTAGLIQATGTAGRFASGLVSDRLFAHRRKPLLIICAAVSGGTALLVSSFTPQAPGWEVLTAFGIFGMTALGFNGLYLTMVVELAGGRAGGLATSFAALAVVLGAVIAPPVVGSMIDYFHSYTVAWQAAAILAAAAILILSFLKETPGDDPL